MPTDGYYRYPTIHNDTIVFVSEDDLWTVPAGGGVARRLTANLGTISHPFFSPDGSLLAFTGREEGHNEVYVMPAEGGPVKRITYLGVSSSVIGWTPDGSKILFSSDYRQPFDRQAFAYAVSPEGGEPQSYPVGHAVSISIGGNGRTVIGRNNNDPARWKRYKGGTAGDIWIDAEGSGTFKRLVQLNGNVARPLCIGDRIVFLSDHEGIGNLYSCDVNGQDLQRHTDQSEYFVRFPNSDGKRIVYHAGADLYVFDPATNQSRKVDVTYYSSADAPAAQVRRGGEVYGELCAAPEGTFARHHIAGQERDIRQFRGRGHAAGRRERAPALSPDDLAQGRRACGHDCRSGRRRVAGNPHRQGRQRTDCAWTVWTSDGLRPARFAHR